MFQGWQEARPQGCGEWLVEGDAGEIHPGHLSMGNAYPFVTGGLPVPALINRKRTETLCDLPTGDLGCFGDLVRGVPSYGLRAGIAKRLGAERLDSRSGGRKLHPVTEHVDRAGCDKPLEERGLLECFADRTKGGVHHLALRVGDKALGRPSALTAEQKQQVLASRAAGVSLGVLAKQFGVSRAAIQRVERRA